MIYDIAGPVFVHSGSAIYYIRCQLLRRVAGWTLCSCPGRTTNCFIAGGIYKIFKKNMQIVLAFLRCLGYYIAVSTL